MACNTHRVIGIYETGCRESTGMATAALRSGQDTCGTHVEATLPPGSRQVAAARQQGRCEQT